MSGRITGEATWQEFWREILYIPSLHNDLLSVMVGDNCFHILTAYTSSIWKHRWNSEWFVIYQTVILYFPHNFTGAKSSWWRILEHMGAWEAEISHMLVKDSSRTYDQYLFVSHH